MVGERTDVAGVEVGEQRHRHALIDIDVPERYRPAGRVAGADGNLFALANTGLGKENTKLFDVCGYVTVGVRLAAIVAQRFLVPAGADVVLKILQKEYDSMKDDINLSRSRKANVLKDVLEHNFPSGTDTKYTELLKSAFNDGALTKEGIGRLQAVGFMISKEERNAHWQFKFGDDRYVAIFSATPSDKARSVKNFVSGYSNILFGY